MGSGCGGTEGWRTRREKPPRRLAGRTGTPSESPLPGSGPRQRMAGPWQRRPLCGPVGRRAMARRRGRGRAGLPSSAAASLWPSRAEEFPTGRRVPAPGFGSASCWGLGVRPSGSRWWWHRHSDWGQDSVAPPPSSVAQGLGPRGEAIEGRRLSGQRLVSEESVSEESENGWRRQSDW